MSRRPRKIKDPTKPKRGMTAFFFYSAERRDEVKADNPDIPFGNIAKILGEEWRAMSEAQKKKYQKMAAKDKKRYEKAMKKYTPDPEFLRKQARANRKRRRDPNAPKRALSAFMIYSKERRPEITSANPHIAFGDIARTIGEEWRSMNAREKKRYEDASNKDKQRYIRAKKRYEAKKAKKR